MVFKTTITPDELEFLIRMAIAILEEKKHIHLK